MWLQLSLLTSCCKVIPIMFQNISSWNDNGPQFDQYIGPINGDRKLEHQNTRKRRPGLTNIDMFAWMCTTAIDNNYENNNNVRNSNDNDDICDIVPITMITDTSTALTWFNRTRKLSFLAWPNQ